MVGNLKSALQASVTNLGTHKVAQPLDGNNQPTNGTSGQSLRTKGDGTTEWADVGLPTDAQTAQAVSGWLDAHPEATTTVQDGSLTEAKFSNALKLKAIKEYVTPEMFGAVGDGSTDDTKAFKDAISYCNTNKVNLLILNKTYCISDTLVMTPFSNIYGVSSRASVIKNTNNYVYAIQMASSTSCIKNIQIDSAYGLLVGCDGGRVGDTYVENLIVTNALVGVEVSWSGGYNRFSRCKIYTIDNSNAVAYLCGDRWNDGAVNTNYVYFDKCTCGPISGHTRTEGTCGIKIVSGWFFFITDCDIVGYDSGVSLGPRDILHVKLIDTTIFDNNKAVYMNSANAAIKDVSLTDCGIEGPGYFLYTEPTNFKYENVAFNNVSVVCFDGIPKGFSCNNLSGASLDGHAFGWNSGDDFERTFNNCTFKKYQSIYNEFYTDTDGEYNRILGDRFSLLPIKRKIPFFNYGGGTYNYSYRDNNNGTVTVKITTKGVINGCFCE